MVALIRPFEPAVPITKAMTQEERRVVVLIPAGDLVHTEFAISLAHMLLYSQSTLDNNVSILPISYGSSILPFSREFLAMAALDMKATHTLWIDSDMSFPRTMLCDFMKHTEPFIGINAMSRRPPFRCTAQSAHGVNLVTQIDSTGLEKVYRCGLGVAWVATEVFQKVPRPWFNLEWLPEHGCFMGEDYWFCGRAKEAGYDIYIDHDISKTVKHIGSFGYNPLMQGIAEKAEPIVKQSA